MLSLTNLFRKTEQRNPTLPGNLSKSQVRQIQKVIDNARRDDGIPRTAQQSIPFQRMFPDGICRVTDRYYTKTIQYQDINYQLAQQEDKTAIFEDWCSFLNFFDSSIHFELSFMNMATDAESFEKKIRIPGRNDHFNEVRNEYSQMLKTQLAQGNNGLTKTKYITFGIEADSMREAKPRLDHVQTNLMNNFKRLGVSTGLLNGKARLQLMHDMFHMGDNDRFYFDWDWLAGSGLSVKDFIAPTSFSFPGGRTFTMGSLCGAMSYLQITASDLSDQLLKDFLDMESSEIVTMHIQSVDQTEAIKQVKHTITELDRSKIEEQKKAVRSGYDMDIIPSDLATYGRDAKALLKELQQNERMFLVTFLLMNTGRDAQELENNVFQASSIAQKHNCNLRRLDFQQEQGLMSSLPLAYNQIEIQRALTTSDLICLEHGLSVIKPKPYCDRQKRTEYPKRENLRDEICRDIDAVLQGACPNSFEEFLQHLEKSGYVIKRGRQTVVKGKQQKRFIRLSSLREGYTEADLRAYLESEGTRKRLPAKPKKHS